jgi:hypothetical protein
MQGARVLRNEALVNYVAPTKDAQTTGTQQVDFLYCRHDVERGCMQCLDLTEQVPSETVPGPVEASDHVARRMNSQDRMASRADA